MKIEKALMVNPIYDGTLNSEKQEVLEDEEIKIEIFLPEFVDEENKNNCGIQNFSSPDNKTYKRKQEQQDFDSIIDEKDVKVESADMDYHENSSFFSSLEENRSSSCDTISEGTLDQSSGYVYSKKHDSELLSDHAAFKQSLKFKKYTDSDNLDLMEYKCHFCDYAAAKEFDLKVHMDSVHSILKKKHKCHLCDYAASHKSTLKSHIEFVHLNLKKHKCHLCEYAANIKSRLELHIDSVHLNTKQHQCHLCEFGTSRKDQLKIHIDSVHLKLRKYKCHLCEYAATQKRILKKHIKVHLKLKENKCRQPDSAQTIKGLQDSVLLKQYKCHLCDFASKRKPGLKTHIDAVHLKLKEHKCNLCDYATISNCRLKKHIDAVHFNFKEHKCQFCDYASPHSNALKRHVNAVHLNLKEHKCQFCDYAASLKDTLNAHIDALHSDL